MFLRKYLNNFYLQQIYDTYEEFYLDHLDEDTFLEVYEVFKKYNFYFIEDIILAYLKIFTLDSKMVERGILKLKEELGSNFVYIIGNDISYLETLIENL